MSTKMIYSATEKEGATASPNGYWYMIIEANESKKYIGQGKRGWGASPAEVLKKPTKVLKKAARKK